MIVQSTPDRKCSSWLYCTTFQRYDDDEETGGQSEVVNTLFDNYDQCIDLAVCKSLDDNKECNNLELRNTNNKEIDEYDITKINKTGYAMLAYEGETGKDIEGYYPNMEIANSNITKSDGISMNFDGFIDLQDKENFKKQLKTLNFSPLVSNIDSDLEWKIKRLEQKESSKTEIKYMLKKQDSLNPLSEEETDIFGVETTIEF